MGTKLNKWNQRNKREFNKRGERTDDLGQAVMHIGEKKLEPYTSY